MRLAGSVSGAHMLLQCSVMSRLAECSMLDMRPDPNRYLNSNQSIYISSGYSHFFPIELDFVTFLPKSVHKEYWSRVFVTGCISWN